jgi:hypothetical protein
MTGKVDFKYLYYLMYYVFIGRLLFVVGEEGHRQLHP